MKKLERFEHRIHKTPQGERLVDFVRKKFVPVGPEEQVRQDVLKSLHRHYGYPRHSLLSEEPVARGTKNRRRADVLVQIPRQEKQPDISVKVPDSGEEEDFEDIPYETAVAAMRKTCADIPGITIWEVPSEFDLEIDGHKTRVRSLGWRWDGYGHCLVVVIAGTGSSPFNLPSKIFLRLQGYGLGPLELRVAKLTGIPQCEWTEPNGNLVRDKWIKGACLAVPDADDWFEFGDAACSEDGSVAWGIVSSAYEFDDGREGWAPNVLIRIDLENPEFKKIVDHKIAELDNEPDDEEQDGEEAENTDGDSESANDVDSETFIVVECKGPDVRYTDEVKQQGLDYAKRLNAQFLVLTNGDGWSRIWWLKSFSEMIEVEDLPSYKDALQGAYSLFEAEAPTPHKPIPTDLQHGSDRLVIYERDYGIAGSDVGIGIWRMLLAFNDFIMQPDMWFTSPVSIYGLQLLEDRGVEAHKVSNPSGGDWSGYYRTILVSAPDGFEYLVALQVGPSLKCVGSETWGNSKSTTYFVVAVADDARFTPTLLLSLEDYADRNHDGYHIWHSGKLTVKKGAKNSEVIAYVQSVSPGLVIEKRIELGTLPDKVPLTWKDVQDVIGRIVAYSLLRNSFKEKKKAEIAEK